MRAPSRQIQSVEQAFGQNGWHCELLEGRDVLRAGFEAHHTHISLFAQTFTPLNALSIVGEVPLAVPESHLAAIFELISRGNKKLTLGGFEYDFDRELLVFRITNIFDRELYDANIISSMVHCTVAELDRLSPYAAIVLRTREELLDDLDIERLLMREDVIPPVPGDEEDEWI